MSNLSSNFYEESHTIPLAIVLPAHGEDVITVAEDETLPSVEETIPRNPKAQKISIDDGV